MLLYQMTMVIRLVYVPSRDSEEAANGWAEISFVLISGKPEQKVADHPRKSRSVPLAVNLAALYSIRIKRQFLDYANHKHLRPQRP